MTVIDCSGDGRMRGRAHGEAAREQVRTALSRWEEATMRDAAEPDILSYARNFIAGTGLLQAVERQMPDLIEEVRGIAEGAAVDPSLVTAYNFMDEQWWYDLGSARVEPGCSLLAVVGPDETLLAQNMDLPDFMDGSQAVLRIRDDAGSESLVLTSAGLIGLTGISRAGLAICVNTLLMLRHNPAGIPVAFAMRSSLAQQDRYRAVAHLRSLDHASGQHFAVADLKGITSLECSAGGVAVSEELAAGSLIHTNHPLASSDIDAMSQELLTARGRIANSQRRYQTLTERIGDIRNSDGIVELLSDQSTPLCMSATPNYSLQTFASMVFSLGEGAWARFCLAQPGHGTWQDVSFDR
ncbi:C45 family peptidase [Sinorhizobium sp. BG8]|uniref:C45 family autoproteolytic acyltransferase/hydolase n=1 Tax=Sinorhizobium sp. BG8 TaxID=2613773 RepID=UPI00193CC3E7|nr:C45 family peptidase [Sinorhizobium sp. BG8]QRM57679.1 6-aminopenicillanic acid acyl-transferase [Sinorhizobium sp. BG8]